MKHEINIDIHKTAVVKYLYLHIYNNEQKGLLQELSKDKFNLDNSLL